MILKQMVLQIGLIAAILTCGLTLWRMLAGQGADLVDAAIRAVGAGLIVVILSLILCGLIEKLGGSPNDYSDGQ
jgi:hypothetical protein